MTVQSERRDKELQTLRAERDRLRERLFRALTHGGVLRQLVEEACHALEDVADEVDSPPESKRSSSAYWRGLSEDLRVRLPSSPLAEAAQEALEAAEEVRNHGTHGLPVKTTLGQAHRDLRDRVDRYRALLEGRGEG